MNSIRSAVLRTASRNVFAAGARCMPRRGQLAMAQAQAPHYSFRRTFVMGNDRLPQVNGVKIEETIANPEAKRRTKRGDTIDVHYRGTLQSDGKEFDASYNRGQPLSFTVGKGQVIKGWDEGLLNMAPGEKRTLTIQPEAGYGSRAMGPIPANSVLVFETELVTIKGVSKDEL